MYQRSFFNRLIFYFVLIALILGVNSVGYSNDTADESAESSLTRLLRYPDIHGNQVVFVYGGDIWQSSILGGNAVRLTAHEGLELFPKFSRDGQWIAFTGQYDGDEQVFVIPSAGGIPRQLTYYPNSGPNPPRRGVENQVLGWTPDNRVLFRSSRESNSVDCLTNIFSISLEGGLPEKLPVPVAGMGVMSHSGRKLVYSPLFRDFRHWKRYEGGWAQYLVIYDFEKESYLKIPTTPRTDRDPMFVGHNVYFLSDRDGTMNLYCYDTQTKEVSQCTEEKQWDLRWASSDGKNKIVYERAGLLYWYNVRTGDETEIPIRVLHDGLAMRSSRINVSKNIESFGLSPQGKRLLVVARGDLFTVPAEKGNVRNITQSSRSHDREAVWSPDGQTIAFISDRTGEEQVYIVDQLGAKPPIAITDQHDCQLRNLRWSPKGNALVVSDARNRIFVQKLWKDEGNFKLDEEICVATDVNGGPLHCAWSPDGNYLAYVLNTEVNYGAIHIWSIESGESVQVTDEYFNHHSPCWSPDGDWLYYLGQREYYPQFSTVEWNFAGNRSDSLFALALRKDVPNLFAPESDEVTIVEEETTEEDEEGNDEADDDSKEVEEEDENNDDADDGDNDEADVKTIDFDQLAGRVVRVPVPSDNYQLLAVAGDFLYYLKSSPAFYGRTDVPLPNLMAFDLKKRKETVFAEKVSVFSLSGDNEFISFKQENALKIAAVGATANEPKTVSQTGLAVDRVPQDEWNEIFDEVWRRFRDYFYVRNMHGYNWEKIGDRYRALIPYVAHRTDLTYILTEMISELNIGHAYVEGGDYAIPARPKCGLPGAVFELDPEANRYRIARIFCGQNEEEKYRSPLTEIGVNVNEGDYLLAVDGIELLGTDNPYRLLRNKENAVTWTVSANADGSDSRTITYVPIASESTLRYLDFVLDRMERVREASDGRVGYFHVPNMGADGAYEFIKWYYPQLRKEGLIIDDRSNGGGNISPWIIMRLNQKLLGTRFGSLRDTPTTYPSMACNAHLICLINETSASDGDIFPYYFRKSGLGQLVGRRSWGGVVGITSRGPLIDGGSVFVPLSGTNDENGEYIIEGYGVDPDIEVEQSPEAVARGEDPQLNKALELILEKVNAEPRRLPERPTDPVKTKKAIQHY